MTWLSTAPYVAGPSQRTSAHIHYVTIFIVTARIVRGNVYVTVRCHCPSVCLCHIRPLQQLAAGLLPWVRRVEDSIACARPRRRSSTGPQRGAQQQMRVVARLQPT